MNRERYVPFILMLALLVSAGLQLASMRRTEDMLRHAIPKWEEERSFNDRTPGRNPGDAGSTPARSTVLHVHAGEVISAAWANSLVDHVNALETRCPVAASP